MKRKRIDSLTQEEKDLMPIWADKWIKKGLKTGETDWATFDKYMPICYEKANLKYPKNIVRVSSPLVGALASAIAEAVIKKYSGKYVDGAVRGAVRAAVDDAVHGAVRDAVNGAVRGAVRGAVGDAVDGEVRDVRDAVNGVVYDAVGYTVCDAVKGAVGDMNGAVGDAVDGAVSGAVDGAVYGAVYGAVDGAVRGAVYGAVHGAVYGAVHGAVGYTVCDAVKGAVGSDVYVSVYGAVGDVDGAVHDVYGAVHGAVCDAVYGAVDEAVKIQKKLGIRIDWHDWLGGQFWVGYHWGGVAFCDFIVEALGLEIDKDMAERRIAYKKVCESVNYIWPNRNFVMVCARPSEIHRNSDGKLHKDGDLAIKYPDGWGLYMLNGVRVPKYLAVTKDTDLDIEWYKKEKNADVKAEFVRKYGIERMVSMGKVVDSYKNHKDEWYIKSEYELIDMSSLFKTLSYAPYLKMKNQTTGIWHMEGVSPECKNIDQALQFRCGDNVKIQSIK